MLNRGGGTSLSGETVNHAVVIDLSRVAGIDVSHRAARVTAVAAACGAAAFAAGRALRR